MVSLGTSLRGATGHDWKPNPRVASDANPEQTSESTRACKYDLGRGALLSTLSFERGIPATVALRPNPDIRPKIALVMVCPILCPPLVKNGSKW